MSTSSAQGLAQSPPRTSVDTTTAVAAAALAAATPEGPSCKRLILSTYGCTCEFRPRDSDLVVINVMDMAASQCKSKTTPPHADAHRTLQHS